MELLVTGNGNGNRPALSSAPASASLPAFDRLATEIAARHEELGARIQARLLDRAPDFVQTLADCAAELSECFTCELRDLRTGEIGPEGPAAYARAAERLREPEDLAFLSEGIRVAQETIWEEWLTLVEVAPGLAAPGRRGLLACGSQFLFRYAERLGQIVAGAYERELRRPSLGTAQRRLQAVRGLIEDDPAAPPLDDFDLERHHLGVLAWGEEPGDTIAELGESLGRPILRVGPIEGVWWGWLSGTRPFESVEERSVERFRPHAARGALALGAPAFGREGFRATHHQAARARWASVGAEAPVACFAQVAAASLAGENPEEARRFVARELRGVEDDSADSLRIRETLLAYFASEHNAASAAARLGVHEQTVANRLRAIEERLGRPVGARRIELELALRLHATFSGIDG